MDFWEDEYAPSGQLGQNKNFDWFLKFDEFPGGGKKWWQDACGYDDKERRILVIGCGHSDLSKKLKDTFSAARIISIDSSRNCIERMKKTESDLEFYVADATNLMHTLPDGLNKAESYDTIIDKGCLDAILAYENNGQNEAQRCIKQVRRLLKETGRFIVVSCTRDHDEDLNFDGYQGGSPACLKFFNFEEDWHIIDRQDSLQAPKNRAMSPLHPDVCPLTYSALIIQRQPPWSDYAKYYRGDYDPNFKPPLPHDAFFSFTILEPFFERWCFSSNQSVIEKKQKICYFLEVGCGNSPLASQLLNRFPNIRYLGTDVVPEAIQQQRERYPQLDLRVADARHLTRDLPSSSYFDVVFDKGTADALFLYDDSIHGTNDHVKVYLDEISHILHPDHGIFLVAACARQDGILHGSQAPRIWTNVAHPAGWRLLAHNQLQSDVGASNDRTFDFLVLRPPISTTTTR
uniref:Methyltransferase domain-containing protein n=1 Tax=Aureoumbra lagunensis TaxID=44058 RepID=A0A7S3K1V3_9STRA|mmetsp:Transcript_43/g.63  ORF Transcript_43/g.63 Transcript_43/m.63 type:complete len:460 (+) Transcript_43:77-1456(+)